MPNCACDSFAVHHNEIHDLTANLLTEVCHDVDNRLTSVTLLQLCYKYKVRDLRDLDAQVKPT